MTFSFNVKNFLTSAYMGLKFLAGYCCEISAYKGIDYSTFYSRIECVCALIRMLSI